MALLLAWVSGSVFPSVVAVDLGELSWGWAANSLQDLSPGTTAGPVACRGGKVG